MRKKVLALLMAVAMVGTLAACGGEAPASSGSTTETSTASRDGEVSESTPAEVKDVALTVWAPSEDQSDETGNWLKTMCEKFNEEHPEWNITFTYGVCAEGDAKSTVTQDVEAAADVYMFANDNLTDLIASNAIAELGGATLDYVNEFIPESLVNSVTVDGGVYGIPFAANTWFMYYNKSMFTEDDVKNLDTMISKAKVSFPLTDSWYIEAFYTANGATFFGDGTDETAGIDLGGENAVAVTRYLVDLVANSNFVNDADGAGIAGMADGSVGALFSGSWSLKDVTDAIGEENVGAVQIPTITIDGVEKQMKGFTGSKAIGVNPFCDDMEVAIALAAYLGGEEGQQSHYDMRGIIPANTVVAASEAVQNNVIAAAESSQVANATILQPFVSAMGNYWSPAENFGKSLLAKEVTLENAEEMTNNLNDSMNKSVVE